MLLGGGTTVMLDMFVIFVAQYRPRRQFAEVTPMWAFFGLKFLLVAGVDLLLQINGQHNIQHRVDSNTLGPKSNPATRVSSASHPNIAPEGNTTQSFQRGQRAS